MRFRIKVVKQGHATGSYELEAPDEDAAQALADDIRLDDPRIVYESTVWGREYPRPMDVWVETEVPA